MKTLQSQLFVGVRILYLVLVLLMMVGISGGGGSFTTTLVRGIVGLAIAFFIVRNYERGRNWARTWMLIALYLSMALYAWDIYQFVALFDVRGFGGWASFGIIVDVLCIAGSAVAAVRVHRAGVLGIGGVQAGPQASGLVPGAEPQAQPFTDRRWKCPECSFKNPENTRTCDNCGCTRGR